MTFLTFFIDISHARRLLYLCVTESDTRHTFGGFVNIRDFDFESDKIFDVLPDEKIEYLKSTLKKIHFKKGNLIFYEDAEPTGIYWISSGRVKVFKNGLDDKEYLFYIYSPGSLLGYHTIFDHTEYFKSAVALEDSELYFISKKDFDTLIDEFPELKEAFLRNMAHEYKVLVNYLMFMSQFEVRERLALSLLGLNRAYYNKESKRSEITLPREDLASLIGTSRESLSRLIKQFKDDGLIELQARTIMIKEPEKLFYISNSVYEINKKD